MVNYDSTGRGTRLRVRQSRAIDARSRTDISQLSISSEPDRGLPTSMMLVFANKRSSLALLLLILPLLVAFCHAVDLQFGLRIPCHDDQSCVPSRATIHTTCNDGFCVCSDNSVTKNCTETDIVAQNNRNTAPTIHHPCKDNRDCTLNNTICNRTVSQCDCLKGYVSSNTTMSCLKKAEAIDYPCTEDKQCISFLPNTTCRDGQCRCVDGHHYAGNGCYKTIDLEKPCTQNEECAHIEGAVCTEENVCNCAEATVLNESKEKCLPVAREILANCTEHVQCNETFLNAVCVNRTCQCQEQYHFELEEQQCFVDKKLDEVCGNTFECYQKESKDDENVTGKAVRCVQNVCTCAENFVREEDKCVSGGTRSMVSLLPLFLATILSVAFSGRY